jgi:hypothetical protein
MQSLPTANLTNFLLNFNHLSSCLLPIFNPFIPLKVLTFNLSHNCLGLILNLSLIVHFRWAIVAFLTTSFFIGLLFKTNGYCYSPTNRWANVNDCLIKVTYMSLIDLSSQALQIFPQAYLITLTIHFTSPKINLYMNLLLHFL